VTAHLGFKAERQLPCGLLAGHEGKHVFHIEWSDRITATRVPRPGDIEEPYRTVWSEVIHTWSRRFGKSKLLISAHMAAQLRAAGHAAAHLDRVFAVYASPPANRPPRFAIPENRPFPNDPPTNRVYPTSFDSWFREYDHPILHSQISHPKSRAPRRR
jgi:hypothetical protein